jgi:hypothetical protein
MAATNFDNRMEPEEEAVPLKIQHIITAQFIDYLAPRFERHL